MEDVSIKKIPKSKTHHGLMAICLHILAIGALMIGMAADGRWSILRLSYGQANALIGFSLSVALVTFMWSCVFAVRAFRSREHPLFPMLVLTLTILEWIFLFS